MTANNHIINYKKNNSKIELFNLVNYLLKVLPYFFNVKIVLNLKQNVLNLFVDEVNLIFLLNFFKKHNYLNFKTLTAITVVDYPQTDKRFELSYFLLSYKLNVRLVIKILINDRTPVASVSSIFNSAN